MATYTIYEIVRATVQDISFWTGFLTVAAFSQGRFSEMRPDDHDTDPPLSAKYFTSRFRYYGASFIYTGVYLALFAALIVLGSYPAFQPYLQSLFGSLEGVHDGSLQGGGPERIGTPAWAAMALMVLAPAVPPIRRREEAFRLWLQEFSSIPFKARMLADEVLQQVTLSLSEKNTLEAASHQELDEIFLYADVIRQHLVNSGNIRQMRRYRDFFSENSQLIKEIQERFQSVQGDLTSIAAKFKSDGSTRRGRTPRWSDEGTPHVHRTQKILLIRRYYRLLVCAMLYVEFGEYDVRGRLRRQESLKNLEDKEFRFTLSQAFVGLAGGILVAFVTGILINLGMEARLGGIGVVEGVDVGGAAGGGGIYQFIMGYIGAATIGAVSFVLPLFLAALVKLHLLDSERYQTAPLEWHGRLSAILLTIAGCYGISALVMVSGFTLAATLEGVTLGLDLALLAALPGGVVNGFFVMWSGIPLTPSERRNALIDFAVFSSLGGLIAVLCALVYSISLAQSLLALPIADGLWGMVAQFVWALSPYIAMAVVLSGLYGSLHSNVSRKVYLGRARVRRRAPVPARA